MSVKKELLYIKRKLLGLRKLNAPGLTSSFWTIQSENSPGTLYIVLVYIHTDFMPVALYTTLLNFAIINYESMSNNLVYSATGIKSVCMYTNTIYCVPGLKTNYVTFLRVCCLKRDITFKNTLLFRLWVSPTRYLQCGPLGPFPLFLGYKQI